MDFGVCLKRLRESKNLTQEELGRIISKDRTSVIAYERENRSPDINTLIKIADYFNVSVDYLIGRTNFQSLEDEKVLPKDKDLFSALNRESLKAEVMKLRNMLELLLYNAYMVIRDSNEYEDITNYYKLLQNVISKINSIQTMSLDPQHFNPVEYVRILTQYKNQLNSEIDELSILCFNTHFPLLYDLDRNI